MPKGRTRAKEKQKQVPKKKTKEEPKIKEEDGFEYLDETERKARAIPILNAVVHKNLKNSHKDRSFPVL